MTDPQADERYKKDLQWKSLGPGTAALIEEEQLLGVITQPMRRLKSDEALRNLFHKDNCTEFVVADWFSKNSARLDNVKIIAAQRNCYFSLVDTAALAPLLTFFGECEWSGRLNYTHAFDFYSANNMEQQFTDYEEVSLLFQLSRVVSASFPKSIDNRIFAKSMCQTTENLPCIHVCVLAKGDDAIVYTGLVRKEGN